MTEQYQNLMGSTFLHSDTQHVTGCYTSPVLGPEQSGGKRNIVGMQCGEWLDWICVCGARVGYRENFPGQWSLS